MKITAVTILTWIGLSIGLSVGAAWALLLNHETLPHRDAVPKDWYKHHLAQEQELRKEHTDAIQELHRDMKVLLQRLIEK